MSDLSTSSMSNPDLGLIADDARIKETPQIYHHQAIRIKPCSKVKLSDIFKDLVEFHDAKNRSKEEMGSQSKTSAERQGTHIDEINPERMLVKSGDERVQ